MPTIDKNAVLLLSSGLDSAANLALAPSAPGGIGSDRFRVAAALTIDYGQRGAKRELEHAAKLAEHYQIPHFTFDLRAFSALVSAKSSLLRDGAGVPEPSSLDDLDVTRKTAEAVWVPNRNGVMLSLAAALAESRGWNAVAVGFNAEEAVTFPDNTVDYMSAMTRSLAFSTANHVEVVSATAKLSKSQIVARLSETDFPFGLLWSCYHSGTAHCGKCESCQRLKRAIETALTGAKRAEVLSSLFMKERS